MLRDHCTILIDAQSNVGMSVLRLKKIVNKEMSGLYNAFFRHQSLEYINEATWKVTLEPEELGNVAAD